MQLVRLVKARGSADPTLTFPGKALAWETPHVPAGLWNSRRQDSSLPENRVWTVIALSGQGCASTPQTHSLFFVVTIVNPGNLAGVGLFFLEQPRCRGELCCSLRIYVTAFGKPHFPPGTGANQPPMLPLQTLRFVTWDLSLSSSLQRDAPVTQDKSSI